MEADDALPAVSVPADVLTRLYEHAVERGRAGEECCGLVVACGDQRFADVVPCRNIMTRKHEQDPRTWPRDNRTAYYMHPEDLRDWLEPERAKRVSAVYHSHVGVEAYLSDEDLAYVENPAFPFPLADQIVMSLDDHKVKSARVFRRVVPGGPFAPMAIEVEHA